MYGLIFVLWILPMIVAFVIGRPKNRLGLAWGLCLGWIGVIILALLPPLDPPGTGYSKCPHCLERKIAEATVCPHCHRNVSPTLAS